MRLVFLGTPVFAVPSLEALVHAGHEVMAVFTQPDRPQGRTQQVVFSPVKQAGLRLGLTVHQPERIRKSVEELAAFRADAMAIVGYGQIIPQVIIDLARYGIINVHGSLLPKYRGAAPIQWAVANGETVTGVTTMRIDAGLDTGDMLLKAQTAIGPDETAPELGERLSRMGAALLVETFRLLKAGEIQPVPQNDSEATLAPILRKEDGRIDWNRTSAMIYNRSRGFLPWPKTFTTFRGQTLYILKAKPANDIDLGASGSLHWVNRRLLAACGQRTALEIDEVQLEGRKRMTAEAFRNGQRLKDNEILGENTN
jgi:methionyl-tRNA formyltransferase